MIVLRVFGGLGNQMFQYALGRHLTHATGQMLRLETSIRDPNRHARFALDRFRIVAEVAPQLECKLLWRPAARVLPCISDRLGMPSSVFRIYRERHPMELDRQILGLVGHAYLIGYWQNEGYFSGSGEVIRRDFVLRSPPTTASARLLDEIRENQSVGVHVRRGDYVHNPQIAAEYNVCDLDYYRRACERVAASVITPRYYVFSNEPVWCKQNLPFLRDSVVVDTNPPEEPWEDLRLMAACKHFVIANSSLSWWAAWLGNYPGKTVVAPARWCVSNWLDVRRWLPADWLVV
jgi:hypothetical protein